jgi:chromate reductase, NAD(P)H dehydrogenase (quinone)
VSPISASSGTHVVGFAGSLRSGSHNAALLREAGAVAPREGTLEIASIAELPLYNFDVEQSAYPPAATALKERVASADGLLIATPEYNNSIPGVAKNAIDWLSRPPDDADRVFAGLPVAIMGASPGRFGTVLAQNAWLPVLRTLGTLLYTEDRLVIPRAAEAFDKNGMLVDEMVRAQLRGFIHGFFEFAERYSRNRR